MSVMRNHKEAAALHETTLDPRSMDAAWKYLDAHHSTAPGHLADLKALRRRVDGRIVPFAFLCYTMQFIDKVLINVITLRSLPHIYIHINHPPSTPPSWAYSRT